MDKRLNKLAKTIVDYSLDRKSGDTIILTVRGEEQFELGHCVQDYCKSQNIKVFAEFLTMDEYNSRWKNMDETQLQNIIDREKAWYQTASATCLIRGVSSYQFSQESSKKLNRYNHEIMDGYRLKRPWLLTSVPTEEMAKAMGVDYETLYDIYLNSCSIDYNKLSLAMDRLVEYMKKAEKVRIINDYTNLEFKIGGLPQVKCVGKRNLPDGELYTAPIKDSVNGYITYNIPSIQNGITHEDVFLYFENGKIVDARSNHTKELNQAFDIDEGARYVGEFSFGLNPFITMPCNSILYDEKINGSLHFTPGACYERCDNGNKSALHWDLVQVQTPQYGGGQIWFDDILIREDGRFVPEDLKVLNPENLLKSLQTSEPSEDKNINIEK